MSLSLSPDEYVKRDDFKSEVEKLAHLEEVSWHQKSIVLWIKGYNNMRFFSSLG